MGSREIATSNGAPMLPKTVLITERASKRKKKKKIYKSKCNCATIVN